MATPTTRFWLFWITLIEAFASFFSGVFFSVWGNELTSPPWLVIMDGWHDGRFWGTLLLVSGGLFLLGLQWTRLWPRVIGCAVTGLIYMIIGVYLTYAPFVRDDALNGSMGAWLLCGALTLTLAAFMWHERYLETHEDRRDDADDRRTRAREQ